MNQEISTMEIQSEAFRFVLENLGKLKHYSLNISAHAVIIPVFAIIKHLQLFFSPVFDPYWWELKVFMWYTFLG